MTFLHSIAFFLVSASFCFADGFHFLGTRPNRWTGLWKFNAGGYPDKKFGDGGNVRAHYLKLPLNQFEGADSLGRIYVASRMGVAARLDQNGQVDPSFQQDGFFHTNEGDFGPYLLPEPNGEMVTCSFSFNARGFVCARFLKNGSPDETFGINGKLEFRPDPEETAYSYLEAIHIYREPTGKIVVIFVASTDDHLKARELVFRYTAAGRPDKTFSDHGMRKEDFNWATGGRILSGITFDTDGKYLLWGSEGKIGETFRAFVMRINSDGTLDSTFGNGGIVRPQENPLIYSSVKTLAGTKDTGYYLFFEDGEEGDLRLKRLDGQGTLDNAFGDGGAIRSIGYDPGQTPLLFVSDCLFVILEKLSSEEKWQPCNRKFDLSGKPDLLFGTEGTACF